MKTTNDVSSVQIPSHTFSYMITAISLHVSFCFVLQFNYILYIKKPTPYFLFKQATFLFVI